MSEEPKRHLRALAEHILLEASRAEHPLGEENIRALHGKLLDLAESIWLAGNIAGRNGRPVVDNPYNALSDADREFVKAAGAVFREGGSEKFLTEPLFPALTFGLTDVSGAAATLRDAPMPSLADRIKFEPTAPYEQPPSPDIQRDTATQACDLVRA